MENKNLIKITFENGESFEILEENSVKNILNLLKNKPDNIMGILVNNEQHSMYYKFLEDSYCRFITYENDKEGERIYCRTLKFILYMAMQRVDPNISIKFLNKTGANYYAIIKSGSITNQKIVAIKEQMRSIILEDLEISKEKVDYARAKKMYKKYGQIDKINTFHHKLKGQYSIYRCGKYINYFYGSMLKSTGDIKGFDLKLVNGKLVLILPSKKNINMTTEEVKENKIQLEFEKSNLETERINCETLGILNSSIKNGQISEIIQFSEAIHSKRIVEVSQSIVKNKNTKVILIAGPSSSGKTTFSRRLSTQLKIEGLNCIPVSMDDFFLEREETPIINGKKNFENIEAIDLKLYKTTLLSLLNGDEVIIPRFDFGLGKKVYDRKAIKMKSNDVLIIEGIHGLNKLSSDFIEDKMKFKIYIAPLTTLNLNDWNKFSSTDMRKIRRMVRDNRDRNLDSKRTLKMWEDVTQGEKENIFPFVDEADYIFNSSLIYELAAMAGFAKSLLILDPEDEHYAEAWRLYKILDEFLPMDTSLIPNNSLIREFIGNSVIKL